MSKSRKQFPSVSSFLRRLRGGSQPILAQASDGCFYAVKFANNLQGPQVLFNEAMGTELYGHFKLTVPLWTPILVTNEFIDRNPSCWIQDEHGTLRPQEGLCFGSIILGCAGCRLFELLDGSKLLRVANRDDFWLAWLLDLCGVHCDHRQAVFVASRGGRLKAAFIDHSHMFAGPSGAGRLRAMASRYLDRRIYTDPTPQMIKRLHDVGIQMKADKLRTRLRDVPAEWTTESAVRQFEGCLQSLSSRSVVDNTIEMMLNAHVFAASSFETASDKSRPLVDRELWDGFKGNLPYRLEPSREVGHRY